MSITKLILELYFFTILVNINPVCTDQEKIDNSFNLNNVPHRPITGAEKGTPFMKSIEENVQTGKQVSTKRGHLEPIGKSGDMSSVDFTNGFLSPLHFLNDYVLQNRPLLMKGAAKVFPAFHLWTDAYLKSKTPYGPQGNVDIEHRKKENRINNHEQINFKDFLLIYNTSDIYMVDGLPIFLQKDIVVPWSLQCDEYKRSMQDIVMWFSSGGTKSVLHHDSLENINCLYRGTKKLVFINTTHYIDIEPNIIDVKDGSYSSMDVEKVDLDKYPFMSGIQFYEADMEPGDCLYIPIKWIHHVASVGSNLAVNIWWDALINTRVDPSKCSNAFDESWTLDKLKIKDPLEQREISEREMLSVVSNLKYIVFTHERKEVKINTFLKALLGEHSEVDELKIIALRILKVIYAKSNNNNYVTEEDIKRLTKAQVEDLYVRAVAYDRIANILGKTHQLTKGLLPDAQEHHGDVEYVSGEEDESLPFVDEAVYDNFESIPHVEL